MLLYEDIISGDEMVSDGFKIIEVDDIAYEVNCRMLVVKEGEVDIGANASAEEELEALEDGAVTVNDVVHSFRLQSTSFDKKAYMTYIKGYMKSVKKYLEENKPDRVPIFEEKVKDFVKKILGNFGDYEFYTGESMNPDGAVALLNYREDGVTPFLTFFKDGLKEAFNGVYLAVEGVKNSLIMNHQSSSDDSENITSFAETAFGFLESQSTNTTDGINELRLVDGPDSDALKGKGVHEQGSLDLSLDKDLKIQDVEPIDLQENAAGSEAQVWIDFDETSLGIASPDLYLIAENDYSWGPQARSSIMHNPLVYEIPFSPITGEIIAEDPESVYNNLLDESNILLDGRITVINDLSIANDSALIYDPQVLYSPSMEDSSQALYNPLIVENPQALYNTSIYYHSQAVYTQPITERSQATINTLVVESSQSLYNPSLYYHTQAPYNIPFAQSSEVEYVPPPIEKSPIANYVPLIENDKARFNPQIIEVGGSRESENQVLAQININPTGVPQPITNNADISNFGNSFQTNTFFVPHAYFPQTGNITHRAADWQTSSQDDAYYNNMRLINWNGMQLVTEDKKTNVASKRYSENYSAGPEYLNQQKLKKRNTLPHFLNSETLRISNAKTARNSFNLPNTANQRNSRQSMILPAAAASHISARDRASGIMPKDRVSITRSLLPPPPIDKTQKTDASAPPEIDRKSSKSNSKSKKCCCCFPATKRGVTYCVILTLLILGVLAGTGYYLFPRTPEFTPKLLRSNDFQENGLNITRTSNDFIATMYLVMNVSVYNPNPYELTIRELELKASLQPNASSLANSGLSGTDGLTKDTIIPSTVVGTGSTGLQIFPAGSTTSFTFPVTIKLTAADFLSNPYLRPDILQTCAADQDGKFARRFTFVYVVTLRNDFLEIFRQTPTITSTSSVLCPLNKNQTEFLQNQLLSLKI